MKLITLNTWGKCGPYQERWNFLLKELARLKPDLLCLQEVVDDGLTQKLQKLLGLTHTVSAYKAGLLVMSRFPILEQRVLIYQDHSPFETKDERRVILAKIKIQNQELMITNTHLTWRVEDRLIRDEQVRELLEAVEEAELPSIICGDLNDVPDSLALKQIQTAGYENLIQNYHPKPITWDNQNLFIQTHKVKFPNRQIDYILMHQTTSKILKPKSCEVVFNRPNEKLIYPSDHYGLLAEFVVR